ncbi:protein LYK5 [Tanacetum coccineum]
MRMSSANQTAVGVKYMLTWLVTWGDNIDYMSQMFGLDVQSILDANELTVDQLIFPFTPVLIPLTTKPKGINTSPAPPPPPAPLAITLAPDGPVLGHKSSHRRVFVGIGIGVSLLLIVSLLGTATNDFAEENKVRGSVYQGMFDGDLAAVKIMNGDVLGEINRLKRLNHSNIIRLSGFCIKATRISFTNLLKMVPLSDWLHKPVLHWKQRVQIVYDVADALNCLHNFMTPPCIHKNLKSSNVLLDGNMRAKITNFGMARSMNENSDDELQLTRHVVGTLGYMPPEYIENGLITPKMDVFAFGVLIAELLSGKEAATRPPDVQLSELIKEVVRGNNTRDKMAGFMDEKLKGEYPVELAYTIAVLASRCVATDLNNRPCMTDVLTTLSKMSNCCNLMYFLICNTYVSCYHVLYINSDSHIYRPCK